MTTAVAPNLTRFTADMKRMTSVDETLSLALRRLHAMETRIEALEEEMRRSASARESRLGKRLSSIEHRVHAIDVFRTQSIALREPPPLRRVVETICEVFGVSLVQLTGRQVTKRLSAPRHAYFYIARTVSPATGMQIAAAIGRGDHTSVYYGCGRARALMREDDVFKAMVERCLEILTGPPPDHSQDRSA